MSTIPQTLHEKLSDPREQRIRLLLEQEIFQSPWARSLLDDARLTLIDFFKYAVTGHQEDLREQFDRLLRSLATLLKTRITRTSAAFEVAPRSGSILVTNHLGIAKLASFDPDALGLHAEQLGCDEPFPLRHACLAGIADFLDATLYEIAGRQPAPFDSIQARIGTVVMTYRGPTGFRELEDGLRNALARGDRPVFVGYPESGTSGKRTNGHPYALEPFRSGLWTLAARLGLDIVPVCQYFDPDHGMVVGVLPMVPGEDLASPGEAAARTRDRMQEWLNARRLGAALRDLPPCCGTPTLNGLSQSSFHAAP